MKKGERRKLELLKIAYRLFLSKGFENTSVDEIIEAAGIAKGTYYYHFESKEQMLEEVIDMMLDAEEEKARTVLTSDMPVPQKLISVIASFRPDESEASIQDTLHRPENIVMHEKINRKMHDRIIPILTELTEQGISEGLFDCDRIPQRMRVIMILGSAIFDEGDYTDDDVSVFIDTAEGLLKAGKGSMEFIRDLIPEKKA